MLVIDMIAAAARAAFMAVASRRCAASASMAAITSGLRAAMALASAAPQPDAASMKARSRQCRY
jgi:hypothetical protein